MNIEEEWKGSFIGKTSEYINSMFNTVLDDPVLLRVAIRWNAIRRERERQVKLDGLFRRCRLDCMEAERRINQLKEENKEFVPKNDYLALQRTHEELLKSSEQLKQNFRNAKVEYKYVLSIQ